MKFSFSINEYDHDGDIAEEGIFLHSENFRIKIGEDISSIDELISNLNSIREEILENNP